MMVCWHRLSWSYQEEGPLQLWPMAGMAPLAVIAALGAAMIAYGRYTCSGEEEHNTDEDPDSDAEEEAQPAPKIRPSTPPPRKRTRLFNRPGLPHHPAIPKLYAHFNITEYLSLTRALNPNLDVMRIVRPAYLSMHLEADRRDQPEPVDNALEIPPDYTNGHYTAELMRWMEMEGQENHPADRIDHDPNTLDQLKLERSCLYIA